MNLVALSIRPPAVAEYGGADAGKTAHYMERWLSRRGAPGPWSETGSATLGASVLNWRLFMSTRSFLRLISPLILIPGCDTAIGQLAPSTPLSPGVFSGTATCDVRVTSPSGDQTIEENTLSVAFEINDRGVPLVQGEEIRVGRTVGLEGVQVTYTRIQPTEDGIVIHSDVSGTVNNVSFSGIAIATLSNTPDGNIEYDFTQTWIDSEGFAYNFACSLLLSP